jgi:4-hydroxybenzoyl-CoA thioesterase
MLTSRRDIQIEWGDCDPAGIVFYPRYFAFFNESTTKLFDTALGMKKIEWRSKYGVVGIPMVDTGAKFIVPSRYGEIITIETRATALRRSSFDIAHRVFKGEVLAIEAHETRVWAAPHSDDPERIQGVPIPPEVVAALSAE